MLVSMLPEIAASAEVRARLLVESTAENIAQDARAGAPKLERHLEESGRVRKTGAKSARVEFTDIAAWFQEFGTTRHGAQPFLIPAAERHAGAFIAGMANLVR